jgi:hypothetical protein
MAVGIDRPRRIATCSSLVMRLAISEQSSESVMATRFGADFVPTEMVKLELTRSMTLRSSRGSRTSDMPGGILIIKLLSLENLELRRYK